METIWSFKLDGYSIVSMIILRFINSKEVHTFSMETRSGKWVILFSELWDVRAMVETNGMSPAKLRKMEIDLSKTED